MHGAVQYVTPEEYWVHYHAPRGLVHMAPDGSCFVNRATSHTRAQLRSQVAAHAQANHKTPHHRVCTTSDGARPGPNSISQHIQAVSKWALQALICSHLEARHDTEGVRGNLRCNYAITWAAELPGLLEGEQGSR